MQNNDIYVFISSTFKDMMAERDYLVRNVFPELRVWCEERGFRLFDIDLRWGISEEEARANKNAVKICLEKIDACRPFFISLIGQRRGWVPARDEISEETLSHYPALSESMEGYSVTELEVLHAILDPLNGEDVSTHNWLLFRKPSYLDEIEDTAIREIYASPDITSEDIPFTEVSDLFRLYKRILQKRSVMVSYTANWNGRELNRFAMHLYTGNSRWTSHRDPSLKEYLLDELKAAFQKEYNIHEDRPVSEDAREKLATQRFIADCAYACFGRDIDQEIEGLLASRDRGFFAVYGPEGCGKSTLLGARAARDSKTPVLSRFIGVSIMEEGWEGLAASIRKELGGAEATDLAGALHQFAQVNGLLCILDGIGKFGPPNEGFLNAFKHPHIKLIFSWDSDCDSEEWERWASKNAACISMPEALTLEEKNGITEKYFSNYLKQLTPEAKDLLFRQPGTDSPMFLRSALDELRVFGVFEDVEKYIRESFCGDITALYTHIINRLQKDIPRYFHFPDGYAHTILKLLLKEDAGVSKQELEKALHAIYPVPQVKCSREERISLGYYRYNTHLHEWTEPAYSHVIRLSTVLSQFAPFVVLRGDRYCFRYEGFRKAVRDLPGQ